MTVHEKENDRIVGGFEYILAEGNLRGIKTQYNDTSKVYTVWYPMKGTEKIEDEESGVCFDVDDKNIDCLISILQQLKEREADIYIRDLEEEKKMEEYYKKKETLLEKIKDAFEDFGIHVTPFYWRKNKLFVTRPIPSGGSKLKSEHVYKLCSGVYIGPLGITWGREWDEIKDKLLPKNMIRNAVISLSKLPIIGVPFVFIVGVLNKRSKNIK